MAYEDERIFLYLVSAIANFCIAIAGFVIVGKYSDAEHHATYNLPWICLLVWSIGSMLYALKFWFDREEGDRTSGWGHIVTIAMWIWGWIIYDGQSGFKWKDFKDEYPEMAVFLFTILIIQTVIMGLSCLMGTKKDQ